MKFIITMLILFSTIWADSTSKYAYRIEKFNNKTLTTEDSVIATSLIQVKDSATTELVATSIELLGRCGRFSKIYSNIITEKGRETLLIKLASNPLISKINISGNYPFMDRDILNIISFYEGSVWNAKEIKKQHDFIKNYYTNEGVTLDTTLFESVCLDRDSLLYEVNITIKSSSYIQLKTLDLVGNNEYSDLWLKLKMGTYKTSFLPSELGAFQESKFKDDMRKLQNYYRAKGFVDTKIEPTIEGNSKKNIDVNILEGFKYKIEFEGNDHFSNSDLKKSLSIFEKGNFHGFAIKKDQKNMIQMYKNEGFYYADVKLTQQDTLIDEDSLRVVTFSITENSRVPITNIDIVGNSKITKEQIVEYMKMEEDGMIFSSYFSQTKFDNDIKNIQNMYRNFGYLKSSVTGKFSIDSLGAKISIVINEGEKVAYNSITINSDNSYIKGVITREFTAIQISNRNYGDNVELLGKIIVDSLVENGYRILKNEVAISLNSDSTKYALEVTIETSQKKYFGGVWYNGLFSTDEDYLNNIIAMDKGEVFNEQKLSKAKNEFHNFIIFKSVKINSLGLDEKSDSVYVFIDFEENKPRYFNGSIIYSTEDALMVKAKIGDKNIFGYNKHVWISGDYGDLGYRGEVGITEPRLLGKKLTATSTIYKEKKMEMNQNFGSDVFGANVSVTRNKNRQFQYGVSQSWERRNMFGDTSPDSTVLDTLLFLEEIRNRNSFTTSPFVSLDFRNSFMKPTKGFYNTIDIKYSKGVNSYLDDFVKFHFDARGFIPATASTTVATMVRAGYIKPLNAENSVPRDQLFYLGGTSSVRGFNENMLSFNDKKPVGNMVSLSGSLELRQDIFWGFELAAFSDFGQLTDKLANISANEFRFSAGGGLRYSTPIGPLSVIYAKNLAPISGEDGYVIHFSIGYSY